jgi:GYF domain 2
MADTQEFYIRNESETEARGPFSIEQLLSLADAGQVTDETLCYDAVTEQWTPISASENLKAAVFPAKKKLVVKKDLSVTTLNKANKENAPITVDDMLAAAEGKTADTKDKSDPTISMARAAKIGMWACVAALTLSAAGGILPHAEAIQAMDLGKLFAPPFAILGAIDLLLAVLLGMGVVTIYPFVRFRAALGFGFIGFIFYTQGRPVELLEAAIGCAGLYLCTVLTNVLLVLVTAAAAILGMAGVSYYLISI